MFFSRWKPFDNKWLLEAVVKQFPEDSELHKRISDCEFVYNGCYFVNPGRPNKKGSEWQFDKSITLEDTIYGDVVLDILVDGRIGSIEYLDPELGRK